MGFEELREEVCRVNRALSERGLVVLTWGNASGADRQAGVMAIKPSGVGYERLGPGDMVIVSLETGEVVEGELRASSDTPTHLLLYQAFEAIGGVVHTHSSYATCWAQAGRGIPCLGTTHADYFYGAVPVTRQLTAEEIRGEYERNTGMVIAKCFAEGEKDPEETPGVLVAGHGPFTWGVNAGAALDNATALEEVARRALYTLRLNPRVGELAQVLQDRHFFRKHGSEAYYGQD